ncbi:uncharacterized protein FYW35_003871 [Pterocles gutturalis]
MSSFLLGFPEGPEDPQGGGHITEGQVPGGQRFMQHPTALKPEDKGEEKRKSRSDKVPWTHIRYTGKSIKGVAMNLSAEVGSIQIRNGSITIPCDGLYLVSLKGSFPDLEEEDLLRLRLWKTDRMTSRALWDQHVHDSSKEVDLSTVLYLFEQDNITLQTSSNATIKDLSFSLVLLVSPFNCYL